VGAAQTIALAEFFVRFQLIAMKVERTIKLFRCYSSLSDEELIPLAKEYISTGRRLRATIILVSIIFLIAFLVGFSIGTLISRFRFENSYALNGIGSGIFITLSFFAINSYQKHEIRGYLRSKRYKLDEPNHRL
jgi:hypothetical protein